MGFLSVDIERLPVCDRRILASWRRGEQRPVLVCHEDVIMLWLSIELLSERDLVEHLQDGLVESLADPIGLR
jgi:hypothetical protein